LIRSTHVPIFRPIAIVFNNQKKQAARATATLVLRRVSEEEEDTVLDVDGSPEVWAPDVKNVSSDTEAKVSGLVSRT
jgi:hypothetical protein